MHCKASVYHRFFKFINLGCSYCNVKIFCIVFHSFCIVSHLKVCRIIYLIIDAMATIKNYASQRSDYLKNNSGFSEGFLMSDICSRVIATCCEHYDVDRSVELVSALFDGGYVKPAAFDLLSELVCGYITRCVVV